MLIPMDTPAPPAAPTDGSSTLLLTKDEAAEELRCSRATVENLIYSGRLPSLQIGRLRRVPRHALENFIAARTEGAA